MEDRTVVIYLKSYSELLDKIERYEKALKEIAEDEENCEYQSELGFLDYYDGYEKTMKAKEVLEG